jgi:hypothetical protein
MLTRSIVALAHPYEPAMHVNSQIVGAHRCAPAALVVPMALTP